MGVLHKATIILVDDDADHRELLGQLLSHEGYLVLSAREGREALARMNGISGAVVAIVDLVMPDMNGWELVTAMKARPETAWIPVVVLTGTQVDAVAGANLLLNKPCDPVDLVASLRALCG